jgi:hypothetical protein
MDSIELALYKKMENSKKQMMNSEYKYLRYMRNKKINQLAKDTHNYKWDETHFMYKYIFCNRTNDNEVNDNEVNDNEVNDNEVNDNEVNDNIIKDDINDSCISKLYKKLALICHPDKCLEKWGDMIFIMINNAYKNKNIQCLETLNSHWEKYMSFDNYNNFDVKKELEKLKSEMWYKWYYEDNYICKEMLIPEDKYNEKLREFNEKKTNH